MRLIAFSVFDVKADAFSAPFWKQTIGQAMRDFGDLANDRNTTVGRHPEDFKLVQIGEFEDSDGRLLPSEHRSLGFAADLVEKNAVIPLGKVS